MRVRVGDGVGGLGGEGLHKHESLCVSVSVPVEIRSLMHQGAPYQAITVKILLRSIRQRTGCLLQLDPYYCTADALIQNDLQ